MYFICAALLLAACNAALGRELKTNTFANANAFAATGDNVASAQQKVAMATNGKMPLVPPSACDNTRSPCTAVKSGSTFKATLSGLKNIKPNTTGKLGLMASNSTGFPFRIGYKELPAAANGNPAVASIWYCCCYSTAA
jgi:hypothetical protein